MGSQRVRHGSATDFHYIKPVHPFSPWASGWRWRRYKQMGRGLLGSQTGLSGHTVKAGGVAGMGTLPAVSPLYVVA